MKTLKHKNNVRLNNGQLKKNGDKFDCLACKTTLSQYIVDKHLKTKTHLDNVEGIAKDLRSSFSEKITKDSSGYCDICNTRYDKKKLIESKQHNENIEEKKLVDEKRRDKVNELGLDHNLKHNRIIISSSDYEDPRFLEALEAMHNIQPHIRFNTFDVVRYTKPTDDTIEENEFTFGLMTRQYWTL